MAFAKKHRHVTNDTRNTKYKALTEREHKVQTLKAANSPDARKLLKRMNDKVYNVGRTNLDNWFCPSGKKTTCSGKSLKSDTINKVLKHKGII